MSSLFVKCLQCNQRPATIKCQQCKIGQVVRLCYSCDSQVHNRQGPIGQQHKTEIIPYQEMYQKAPQSAGQTNLGNKFENVQNTQKKQQPQQSQQSQGQFKFTSTTKQEPPQLAQKPIANVTKPLQQPAAKEINFSGTRSNNKPRYDQKEEEQYNSSQKNSDQKASLNNQLKEEQDTCQQLKKELKQAQDQLNSLNKEVEKKIKSSQQELETKLNDLKKEGAEEKKKTQQLTEDVKKLKEQLKNAEQQTQKKLDQQKKQYEKQMQEMQQTINDKQQQIDEIAQEFQNYNLEDIQAKMEEMANDINMKDQIIEQLQTQLQKGEGNQNGDEQEGDKDEILAQIEQKDQEIKKLEELIENFKQLYQHMLDEKQVIMEENEKLANENNQFREIFSQNLHLFGIDPNQLEEDGEGEDGEGQQEEDEIIEKQRPMIRLDIYQYHFPNIQLQISIFSFQIYQYYNLNIIYLNVQKPNVIKICQAKQMLFSLKMINKVHFLDYLFNLILKFNLIELNTIYLSHSIDDLITERLISFAISQANYKGLGATLLTSVTTSKQNDYNLFRINIQIKLKLTQ